MSKDDDGKVVPPKKERGKYAWGFVVESDPRVPVDGKVDSDNTVVPFKRDTPKLGAPVEKGVYVWGSWEESNRHTPMDTHIKDLDRAVLGKIADILMPKVGPPGGLVFNAKAMGKWLRSATYTRHTHADKESDKVVPIRPGVSKGPVPMANDGVNAHTGRGNGGSDNVLPFRAEGPPPELDAIIEKAVEDLGWVSGTSPYDGDTLKAAMDAWLANKAERLNRTMSNGKTPDGDMPSTPDQLVEVMDKTIAELEDELEEDMGKAIAEQLAEIGGLEDTFENRVKLKHAAQATVRRLREDGVDNMCPPSPVAGTLGIDPEYKSPPMTILSIYRDGEIRYTTKRGDDIREESLTESQRVALDNFAKAFSTDLDTTVTSISITTRGV